MRMGVGARVEAGVRAGFGAGDEGGRGGGGALVRNRRFELWLGIRVELDAAREGNPLPAEHAVFARRQPRRQRDAEVGDVVHSLIDVVPRHWRFRRPPRVPRLQLVDVDALVHATRKVGELHPLCRCDQVVVVAQIEAAVAWVRHLCIGYGTQVVMERLRAGEGQRTDGLSVGKTTRRDGQAGRDGQT